MIKKENPTEYARALEEISRIGLEIKGALKKEEGGKVLNEKEQQLLQRYGASFRVKDAALQKALVHCADVEAEALAKAACEQLCALGANEHLCTEGGIIDKAAKDPKKLWLLKWLSARGVDLKKPVRFARQALADENGWISPFYIALGSGNTKGVEYLLKDPSVKLEEGDVARQSWWGCGLEYSDSILTIPLGIFGDSSKGLGKCNKMLEVLFNHCEKTGQLDVGAGCGQLLREFIVHCAEVTHLGGSLGGVQDVGLMFENEPQKKSFEDFLNLVLPRAEKLLSPYVVRSGMGNWDVRESEGYRTHLVEQAYVSAPEFLLQRLESAPNFKEARQTCYESVEGINKTMVVLYAKAYEFLCNEKGLPRKNVNNKKKLEELFERVYRFEKMLEQEHGSVLEAWREEGRQILKECLPLKEKGYTGDFKSQVPSERPSGSVHVLHSIIESGTLGYVGKHLFALFTQLSEGERQRMHIGSTPLSGLTLGQAVEGASELEVQAERLLLNLQMPSGKSSVRQRL